MLDCATCGLMLSYNLRINTGLFHATVHGSMHQDVQHAFSAEAVSLVVCSVGDVHRL